MFNDIWKLGVCEGTKRRLLWMLFLVVLGQQIKGMDVDPGEILRRLGGM